MTGIKLQSQSGEYRMPAQFNESANSRVSAGAGIELTLYSAKESTKVFQLWRELEQNIESVPLACSADWTECWLAGYGETVRPWFVVGRTGGAICGICLLVEAKKTQWRLFPETALYLGTAGEPKGQSVCVEYNDVLVRDENRRAFLRSLQYLIMAEKGWDCFRMNGLPVDGETEWPVAGQVRKGLRETSLRVRECRYFDLAACREAGGDILSQLGKSTKSNLKRRMKKMDPITVEWAESIEQAEEIFDEMVALHQARWQAVGQPGAFASKRFDGFQRSLIKTTFATGKTILVRIKSGAQTIGCLYLLNDRNRLLDYVSGFVSFDEVPSCGLISHFVCMNEALARGYDAYDFLVGEKQHKQNLGKSAQDLQWITCERRRLMYRLRDAVRTSKQSLKSLLKPRAES